MKTKSSDNVKSTNLHGHVFRSMANKIEFEKMVSEAIEFHERIHSTTDTSLRNQMSIRKDYRVRRVVTMVMEQRKTWQGCHWVLNVGKEMRAFLVQFCDDMGYSYNDIRKSFLNNVNAEFEQ